MSSLTDRQQMVEADETSELARLQPLKRQQQEQVMQLQQLENRLEVTQQRLERTERQMAAMAQAHMLEIQKLEEAAAAREDVSVAARVLPPPADFDARVVSMQAEISDLRRRLEADGAVSAAAAADASAAKEGVQGNSHNAGGIAGDIQDNSAAEAASGGDVQRLHDHLRRVTQQLAEARAKADEFEVNFRSTAQRAAALRPPAQSPHSAALSFPLVTSNPPFSTCSPAVTFACTPVSWLSPGKSPGCRCCRARSRFSASEVAPAFEMRPKRRI